MTIIINEDGIDRPATEAEIVQLEKDAAAEAKSKTDAAAKVQAKAEAKAELLERLGITADEAKLLLA
jgi:hypothetical protein